MIYNLDKCVDVTALFELDTGVPVQEGYKIYMFGMSKYFWYCETDNRQSIWTEDYWAVYHNINCDFKYGE